MPIGVCILGVMVSNDPLQSRQLLREERIAQKLREQRDALKAALLIETRKASALNEAAALCREILELGGTPEVGANEQQAILDHADDRQLASAMTGLILEGEGKQDA